MAEANDCKTHPTLFAQYGPATGCSCGSDLLHVEISLPKELKLVQVCELRDSKGHKPDLSRERISLDRYDANGNTYDGKFVLQGSLHLQGVVSYEPSDGGDLWFMPRRPVIQKNTAFEPHFRQFALRMQDAYVKLKLSKARRVKSSCLQAKADLILRDFVVLVDESEGAGISPNAIEVKSISSFEQCK